MTISNRPPRLIRLLVDFLVPRSEREFFLGDLDEMFAANRKPGHRRRSLIREVLGAAQLVIESRRHAVRPTKTTGDNAAFEFARDVRFGLRMMARSPAFTTVALLTMALGIGANTAILSVVDAVLLEPLPFLEPERLMRPSLVIPPKPSGPTTEQEIVWSVPKYEVFKTSQKAFSASAVYSWFGITLIGDGEPERVTTEIIESSYLGVLGIMPQVGSGFTPEDDLPGSSRRVLLSHALWLRRWGGDPSVLGRSITTSGNSYIVVGVLPAGFKGLSGRAELFVPYSILDEPSRASIWSHSLFMVARLKDGVTPIQARTDMEAVARRIDEAFPTTDVSLQGWGVTARLLNDLRADPALRTSILLLLGAVVFVLLIACVNLANLLLARASGRGREMSIRVAVGAGRARIVRQLLAEGLVLSVGGAAVGLGLAYLSVVGIRSLGPATHGVLQGDVKSLTVLGLDRIAVDGTTLLFTLALALITGLLFGLVPALKASRPDLMRELKEGGRWQAGSRRFGYLSGRGILVVAEFSLAFVLLVGSGLMLKSFLRLYDVQLGFESESILTGFVSLPGEDYGRPEREIFFTQLLERVSAIPGVTSAAMGDCPPVSGGCMSTVIRFFDRPPVEEGAEPHLDIHLASPGFFETLGVPLIRGRTFDNRDRFGEHLVAVVSQRTADEFWPGEDPIGKTVGLGQGGGFWDGTEVVGVVGDVHYETIETQPELTAYVPLGQAGFGRGYLFVRVQGDPAAVAGPVKRVVTAMDSDVPVTALRTMEERIAAATVRTRFSASLLSIFAAVALGLSTIGIFGVLSYLVAQQTREIGIRLALGAQRAKVFRHVLQRALVLTALGVFVGGTASLGLMRFMGSLLFEVRPDDPTTLALVALTLSAVSLAAAYVPAWRATRIEPLEALRES
jgi:putative ABC transport system permease protein